MSTPSNNYMKLIGGTRAGESTIYTSDDSAVQNLIKVGDIIKVSGTADNNGVYTVAEITTDGTALGTVGDVYYSLKGQILTNETSAGSTDPVIEVVRAPGDKLCALGDVESDGGIDVWSNNATTDYVGVSPNDADGWINNAINPTLSGDSPKYIFHFADEALRVCNINEQNTSFIKWYGYIQKKQFASTSGLVFAGWQENPNTLAPPKLATSFTFAYGHTTHDGSDNSASYYQNNRGVAIAKKDSVSNLRFRANTGRLTDMLPSAKKTFFAGALNSADSVFEFAGNNGDGTTTLIDSDGFASINSATFVVSSGTGVITNGASSQGSVSLRLPTIAGEAYQVGFDVLFSTITQDAISKCQRNFQCIISKLTDAPPKEVNDTMKNLNKGFK